MPVSRSVTGKGVGETSISGNQLLLREKRSQKNIFSIATMSGKPELARKGKSGLDVDEDEEEEKEEEEDSDDDLRH